MEKDLSPLFLFIGVIVGAGVLGLPKAVVSAGWLGSAILMLVGAAALYLGALMLAEMSIKIKQKKHIAEIIQHYFPFGGNVLGFVFLFTVMYAALTAYIIGSGDQINSMLSLDKRMGSLLFFVLAAIPVLMGLQITADVAVVIGIVMLLALLAIVVVSLTAFNLNNLPVFSTDPAALTGLFSVALFALFGHNVIPEITWLCEGKKDRIRKVIGIGLLVPLISYLLFGIVVAGVLGQNVTDVGTVGLANVFGSWVGVVISLFAVAAMYTSFIGIAISMRHVYTKDFGLPIWAALLLILLPPLLLYGLDTERSFLGWIGDVGGRMLNLFMILVASAYLYGIHTRKIKPTMVPMPMLSAAAVIILYAANLVLSFL